MGVRKLVCHILDVGHELGWNSKLGILAPDALDVLWTALLNHLKSAAKRGRQQPETRRDDIAENRRALTSAGHQNLQRRDFVERWKRQFAQARNLGSHRIADQNHLVREFVFETINLLIGRPDRLRLAGKQAVDAAHHRILLMDQGRDLERACRKKRGECRIAAEADHCIGPVVTVEPFCLSLGL